MAFYHLTLFALMCLALVTAAQHLRRKLALWALQRRTGALPPKPLTPGVGFMGRKFIAENLKGVQTGTIAALFKERMERCGPTYGATVLGETTIFTHDPDIIRALWTRGDPDWGASMRAHKLGWAPFAEGTLVAVDGEEWTASRGKIKPIMHRSEVSQLTRTDTHCERMLERLREAAEVEGGATVDLQRLFLDATVDSSLEYALGRDTASSLTAKEAEEAAAFGNAIERGVLALGWRNRTPPWLRRFMVRANRQFNRDSATVHAFVERMIARHVERLAAKKATFVEESDGREQAEVSHTEEQPEGFTLATELLRASKGDIVQTRKDLLGVLVGNRDTTSSLLSHVFFRLARHPNVWKRLREEVAQLDGRKPDFTELKAMRYLRYVLNETLRVHPVFPGVSRHANRDTVLPRGGGPDGSKPCLCPKGTMVLLYTPLFHRDKEVWGVDADEWRPDRWYDEHLRPGSSFIPFGAGPRVCPGQQLAMIEASYVTVRIAQTFSEIESRDDRPYMPRVGLSVTPAHGVLVELRK